MKLLALRENGYLNQCIEPVPGGLHYALRGIFAFHYLFRKGKPWYTERNESKVINREVPL